MAKLGNGERVYIKTSSSGTETWLAGEQTNSFNLSTNLIETSDKSSSWQQFISGIKGATAEVTVFADDSATEQTSAITNALAGDSVWVRIGPAVTGSATGTGWQFEAKISAIGDTNDNGAVSTRSLSLTATGAVTHS